MFLEECKYVAKEKKIPKYIIKDIEVPFDKSDKGDSEEEFLMKKILMKNVPIKETKIFYDCHIQNKIFWERNFYKYFIWMLTGIAAGYLDIQFLQGSFVEGIESFLRSSMFWKYRETLFNIENHWSA